MNTEKIAIPISIVVAGVLIAGSLYLSNGKLAEVKAAKPIGDTQTANANDSTTGSGTVGNIRPISADDHILGNPNADVVIIEYSDLECPYCKMFHPTLQRVMNEYGKDGKVAWVYRHMPLSQLHSKAPKEAEATECAWDQGGNDKFWEFTNMVYDQTQSNNSLDPAQLPVIAKNVGLDVKKFNDCLSSGKFTAKVQADYNDGLKAINNPNNIGTPYSVLVSKDGTKTQLPGAVPYTNLKNIIDALLN